jgi:hypothetical protein
VSLESVVAELNEIVRPDGAELVVREATMSSVRLELDLSRSSCPECVVPKELLLEILAANLARVAPDVREIELHDPRETSGPTLTSARRRGGP